jgi:heptosyltransferase I
VNRSDPQLKSLLVVRLGAMGDIIHAMPAVAALRQAFPDVTLGWLVEERWSELLCAPGYPRSGPRSPQRPIVDQVHFVNTAKWRRAMLSSNTWRNVASSLREFRGVHYDAVIDFQGAIRSAFLARWSGASAIYGSAKPREAPAQMLYTAKVALQAPHVVEQAFELVAAVTQISSTSAPRAEFPVDFEAENKIARLVSDAKHFAVLNPGAGWGAKRWPTERYGLVAKQLAKSGLLSLVNYGPGEEDLAGAVEAVSDGAARGISCTITELIALTRRASLFIGGDTGPMHMAAALSVPVVAIFGPTDPARNGPFGTQSIVLRSASSVTDHTRHRDPEQGLLEITAVEVISAARKLLQI